MVKEVLIVLIVALISPGLAERNPQRKAAIKRCRQEFRAAKQEAKKLSEPERKEKMIAARRAFRDCMSKIPR
jgi:hypothetical protein